jgi:hypothetical protein
VEQSIVRVSEEVVVEQTYNYVLVSWNTAHHEVGLVDMWLGQCPEPDDLLFIDSDIDLEMLDSLYEGRQITTVGNEVYKLEKRDAL